MSMDVYDGVRHRPSPCVARNAVVHFDVRQIPKFKHVPLPCAPLCPKGRVRIPRSASFFAFGISLPQSCSLIRHGCRTPQCLLAAPPRLDIESEVTNQNIRPAYLQKSSSYSSRSENGHHCPNSTARIKW